MEVIAFCGFSDGVHRLNTMMCQNENEQLLDLAETMNHNGKEYLAIWEIIQKNTSRSAL